MEVLSWPEELLWRRSCSGRRQVEHSHLVAELLDTELINLSR